MERGLEQGRHGVAGARWAVAGAFGSVLAAASCSPPARMCVAGGDCGTTSSCVAGRCVTRGAVVAIANARRLLFEPVEVGYVRRGENVDASATPFAAPLGGGDGARAFLRFAVVLPPQANLLEAYLLLDRAPGVDPDPVPIALHLAPVVDAWDGRTLSWARQPRTVEVGSPVTRVLPAAAGPIRLDVRGIVERWRRRSDDAQGVAIEAEEVEGQGARERSNNGARKAGGPSDASEAVVGRGVVFALSASSVSGGVAVAGGAASGPVGKVATDVQPVAGPRLELYVR